MKKGVNTLILSFISLMLVGFAFVSGVKAYDQWHPVVGTSIKFSLSSVINTNTGSHESSTYVAYNDTVHDELQLVPLWQDANMVFVKTGWVALATNVSVTMEHVYSSLDVSTLRRQTFFRIGSLNYTQAIISIWYWSNASGAVSLRQYSTFNDSVSNVGFFTSYVTFPDFFDCSRGIGDAVTSQTRIQLITPDYMIACWYYVSSSSASNETYIMDRTGKVKSYSFAGSSNASRYNNVKSYCEVLT
nr:hypothetical protein [Candidatus Sigynarchaeota archaeon]